MSIESDVGKGRRHAEVVGVLRSDSTCLCHWSCQGPELSRQSVEICRASFCQLVCRRWCQNESALAFPLDSTIKVNREEFLLHVQQPKPHTVSPRSCALVTDKPTDQLETFISKDEDFRLLPSLTICPWCNDPSAYLTVVTDLEPVCLG